MATSGGSIAGTLLTYKKPSIPDYPLVDQQLEQLLATKGNIAALPKLQQLASRVNEISSTELLKQFERMLPGYSGLRDKGTGLIESQLRGEIPDDVAREIQRHSAERATAGGYGNSEAMSNLVARDLGLTSLEITNRALGSAERWMATARASAPQFDFTQMFITPQQRIQTKLYENSQVYQNKLLKSQVDAMPEAWEAALATLFDNIEEMGSSALSMYAGGAMGGGGGGSMMGGGGAGSESFSRNSPGMHGYGGLYGGSGY